MQENQNGTNFNNLRNIDKSNHKPEWIFPCQSAAIAGQEVGQD